MAVCVITVQLTPKNKIMALSANQTELAITGYAGIGITGQTNASYQQQVNIATSNSEYNNTYTMEGNGSPGVLVNGGNPCVTTEPGNGTDIEINGKLNAIFSFNYSSSSGAPQWQASSGAKLLNTYSGLGLGNVTQWTYGANDDTSDTDYDDSVVSVVGPQSNVALTSLTGLNTTPVSPSTNKASYSFTNVKGVYMVVQANASNKQQVKASGNGTKFTFTGGGNNTPQSMSTGDSWGPIALFNVSPPSGSWVGDITIDLDFNYMPAGDTTDSGVSSVAEAAIFTDQGAGNLTIVSIGSNDNNVDQDYNDSIVTLIGIGANTIT